MQNGTAPTATQSGALQASLNQELDRVDAHVGDTLVGFSAYEICEDGCRTFHHTEVFEEHSGHGYGKELAAGVMEVARREGFQIVPTCSFIKKYMDEHPETGDLRAG